jgi:hypothetical protein
MCPSHVIAASGLTFGGLVIELIVIPKLREPREQGALPDVYIGPAEMQALLSQYQYQDQHSWSHVNTLSAIQVATLAGAYAVRKEPAFFAVIGLGFLLTLVLHCLIQRIKFVRDYNMPLIQRAGIAMFGSGWVIRPEGNPFMGDDLQRFAVRTFLVADVAALFLLQ